MSRDNNWEVNWSPYNPKKFIRYNTNETSSEIYLYNVYEEKEVLARSFSHNQVVKLADDVFASPVTGFPDYISIKSVEWCPRKDLADHCILALGLSNGRLTILNIGQEPLMNTGMLLSQEFAPKYDRTCHEISWNQQEQNLIAVALDKVRYENSLLVWDVESKGANTPLTGVDHRPFTSMNKKQLYEHGSGESTLSVCWLPHLPRTLIAGQGSKWLRMLDMRSPNTKAVTSTKAINGICVDPFNPQRIATFIEGEKGSVCVWDIRHPEKPLVTINQSKPISKILWCPTRNHLLSVLQKDSTFIKNYDLQFLASGSSQPYSDDEIDHISERSIQLPKSCKSCISSYSWHPTNENTVLTATNIGALHYLKVFETITMSWSPCLQLVWGCGKHMSMCSRKNKDKIVEDISSVMRKRAISGYGEPSVMKSDSKLKDILGDVFLTKLWTWIRKSRKQRDDTRKPRKFYGVKAIIKGKMNALDQADKKKCQSSNLLENKSKSLIGSIEKSKGFASANRGGGGRFTKTTVDEGNGDEVVFARTYTSDDRKLALSLCEWDVSENILVDQLKRMAVNGEPERAAAMALFLHKLELTIEILSGPINNNSTKTDPSLPIVAMALSGCSERKSPLWINNCIRLCSKLTNAYLRAIFAFLTADDEDFTDVLKETDLLLGDRIAFACRYLSDTKLLTYVENVTTTMITQGNLEGLLLTGLTSDGIDLLENFITKTSDVQTAILIALTSKVSDALKDARVINWIENYRDLLDRWRLWHERGQFDAIVQMTDGCRKNPQQITVTCTYCAKSVSYNMLSSGGVRGQTRYLHGVGSSRQNKAMSCPACRQQLPRCSVCLINMGSLSSHAPRSGSKTRLDTIVNSFQTWFTWCQNCRHGGHAVHLKEWFDEHIECPVTGCTCCCNVQDSVAMVTPIQSAPVDSSEEIGTT